MGFFASLHQLNDVALLLILRIALGSVFLVHGLPKRGLWSAQPSAQLPAGMLRNTSASSRSPNRPAPSACSSASSPNPPPSGSSVIAVAIMGRGKYALDRVIFGI